MDGLDDLKQESKEIAEELEVYDGYQLKELDPEEQQDWIEFNQKSRRVQ